MPTSGYIYCLRPPEWRTTLSNQAQPTTGQPVKKAQYRVANWPEYDRALVRRGSLTVWFDDGFLGRHRRPAPNGRRGAPFEYSEIAIRALLTLKAAFRLPYRAVEGLGRPLVRLMGLAWAFPTTPIFRAAPRLCKRAFLAAGAGGRCMWRPTPPA